LIGIFQALDQCGDDALAEDGIVDHQTQKYVPIQPQQGSHALRNLQLT